MGGEQLQRQLLEADRRARAIRRLADERAAEEPDDTIYPSKLYWLLQFAHDEAHEEIKGLEERLRHPVP